VRSGPGRRSVSRQGGPRPCVESLAVRRALSVAGNDNVIVPDPRFGCLRRYPRLHRLGPRPDRRAANSSSSPQSVRHSPSAEWTSHGSVERPGYHPDSLRYGRNWRVPRYTQINCFQYPLRELRHSGLQGAHFRRGFRYGRQNANGANDRAATRHQACPTGRSRPSLCENAEVA